MSNTTNIILVGVGGQGILLASEILSEVSLSAGFDVKKNEVHGMSQRGGSVISFVRFGDEVFSPTVAEGDADFLLGFELMETVRYLSYLKKNGVVISNKLKIPPPSVLMGNELYPEQLESKIAEATDKLSIIDCDLLAIQAGNIRSANSVMLGALSKHLHFQIEKWMSAIEKMVPKKAVDLNQKAFLLGREV